MLYELVGQQSKKKHWINRERPKREVCVTGKKNIPLVSKHKVMLPPLHINLCLIKQFFEGIGQRRRVL